MSISVVLVPFVVAAVAAWEVRKGGRPQPDEAGQTRTVCAVRTRMRDTGLLGAALRELGAVVTETDGELVAVWQEVRARFVRDEDGIWTAHFTGTVDETRAVEAVQAIDAAYGRHVQRAVVQRLRDRAPEAGMLLESESVGEDSAVTLVFAVRGEG
ncbi:MAG: hypothetical protein GXX79_14355 [Actinomycetales bacterium]|nr:hypothetical protein [Actinomycetales bacterium]